MNKNEEEKVKFKKIKHRPNQLGVGMRILNEHDADSIGEESMLHEYDEVAFYKEYDLPDPNNIDDETLKKYLKNP